MAKERLSPEQIKTILNALEEGRSASDLAKEYRVSLGSIYMWKAKYQKQSLPPDAARLQRLDEENNRLKCLVADLLLENQDLKTLIGKSGPGS